VSSSGDVDIRVQRLRAGDVVLLREMLAMFGEAFGEVETFAVARPSAAYLARVLGSETVVALVAVAGDRVVGGLVAYELQKLEQERSEMYIYDLAVAEGYRRRGIATALIREVQRIGAARGAWVAFVQADYVDPPAIALYTKLGTREEVLHFDITIPK
jgi:aminoglycoside 3-N-acetyltransferase I